MINKRFLTALTVTALVLGGALLLGSVTSAVTVTNYTDKKCSGGTLVGSVTQSTNACVSYCQGLTASCCTTNWENSDFIGESYTCSAYTNTTTVVNQYPTEQCFGDEEPQCIYREWTASLFDYSEPQVTASLVANPTTITSSQSSLLTWSSTGATSCTGTNFVTGGATSDSVSVSPDSTTTYTVSCANGTNSAQSSATVTHEDVLAVSCTATPYPAEIFGPVWWSAEVAGSNGPLEYEWSGSDGLTGAAAYVQTSYNSIGNKSARVTVTQPSTGGTGGTQTTYTEVPLGYGQCIGGVLANQWGESEDADMVPLSIEYLEAQCSGLATDGQCCDVTVTYPPNAQQTIMMYYVYDGATVTTNVTKSCNTPPGSECEFLAGIATETTVMTGGTGGTPAQTVSAACALPVHAPYPLVCEDASCDCTGPGCELIVEEGDDTDVSANTPTLYSGLNEVGNSVTFLGTITNLGNNTIDASFQNKFQVDIDGDGAGTYDFDLDAPTDAYVISIGGTGTVVSPTWTNIPEGVHKIRFCADLPPYNNGSVSEVNEGNNCSGVLTFAVGPSLLDLSIVSSAGRVRTNNPVTITWVATNADSCSVSGDGLSSTATSGSQNVTILGERTYTITCLRGTLSQSDSVTVRVVPKYEEI